MRQLIYPLAAALIVAGPVSASDNWGDAKASYPNDPEYAASKAICRRLGKPQAPPADRPTPAQVRALKGCDSEALYYGEKLPVDYAKARQCALIEAQGDDETAFAGSTILMQIYANGRGVARDLDLATAYACQVDGSAFDVDARIRRLQAIKSKPAAFDYCDGVSSDWSIAQCMARDSRAAAVRRDARIAALIGRLPRPARAAYPPLQAALNAFVEAHGHTEFDDAGTSGDFLAIGEEDSIRDQFEKDLRRLAGGDWPGATAADVRAADTALNASYRKALADSAKADLDYQTGKAGKLRAAQRAWIAYRDTYVRFAALAAPGLSVDAVTARLTRLRTAQLDDMLRDK